VMRTARKLGIQTVAVYSDVDKTAMHVQMADEAYHIGAAAPQESYLRADRILEVAKRSGAQAVHPGYGFLSESTEFAEACGASGVLFIGPPAQAIRDMGVKSTSKHIMQAAGVPVIGGYHGEDQSDSRLRQEADKIGFPVMIKAVRGGGGKGMRIALTPEVFQEQLESARREATKSFGDEVMLVEKYVDRPRHVEVQVFGDTHGNYVYLFERDCSVQRRHQKIIEEAPGPGISPEVRQRLGEAAVRAARAVAYEGAGTVEFIMDDRQDFYFMEMNTRLQVEHPVTEEITGTDLVEWQVRVAAGERLPLLQEQLAPRGHAFEARVYAEDPSNSFMPGAGPIQRLTPPPPQPHLRVETGVREGDEVSVHYDPMIAKLVVWGPDRPTAAARLQAALAQYNISGLSTNVDFMMSLLRHPQFKAGNVHTDFIKEHYDELFPDTPVTEEHLCEAALALVLQQQRDSLVPPRSPFSPLAPAPRLGHPLRLPYTLRCGDTEHAVTVQRDRGHAYTLTVDGGAPRTVSGSLVEAEGATELRCEVDGAMRRTRVMLEQDACSLFAADGTRRFEVPPPAYVAALEGGAVAPMPGVVEAVLVKEGAEVQQGDPLVVIIAMKMEFIVKAPTAGTVSALLYAKGDTVAKGAPLLRLAPLE